MLTLNFQNVEELIFYDKNAQKLMPEFKNLFDSWAITKQSPSLRTLGIKIISDFLDSLKQIHIVALSEYFGNDVKIDKMDYSIVKNYDWELEQAEIELNKITTFSNLLIYREDKHIFVSFWR